MCVISVGLRPANDKPFVCRTNIVLPFYFQHPIIHKPHFFYHANKSTNLIDYRTRIKNCSHGDMDAGTNIIDPVVIKSHWNRNGLIPECSPDQTNIAASLHLTAGTKVQYGSSADQPFVIQSRQQFVLMIGSLFGGTHGLPVVCATVEVDHYPCYPGLSGSFDSIVPTVGREV